MGPVFMFVLVATATLDHGRLGYQTVGYYATAAQCHTALLAAEREVDGRHVRFDCRPIRAVP